MSTGILIASIYLLFLAAFCIHLIRHKRKVRSERNAARTRIAYEAVMDENEKISRYEVKERDNEIAIDQLRSTIEGLQKRIQGLEKTTDI